MNKEQTIDITSALKNQFIPFAGGELLNKIPSIDGFLPSHRKIILSMMRNNRVQKNPYKKTASIMGEIMAYYVHGDSPLYSTMVNMTNNGMNNPLIDGYGQWGNKFSANGVPAAQRYTSCRTTKYGEAMYQGVNSNAVPMKPNYDNTTDEPIIMPSIIPNILTNTSQSIAVGEASKIPAHNLNDVCSAISNYINHKDNNRLIKEVGCPDLSSGGKVVYDEELFKNIYNTGKGSFTLIGSFKYNEKSNRIEIYEIPYETTIEAINDKVVEMTEKGAFKEVSSSRVGTGKDGMRLDIDLKKNVNVDDFILKLRRYTPFESKMSVNFTLLDLDWKTPKLMTLQNIVDSWIQHRMNCIVNESNYSITNKKKRVHLLEGLKQIRDNLGEVVITIRNSSNDGEAILKLQSEYELSEKQAEYVAEMKLRNLNIDYVDNRLRELDKLYEEISDLVDLVSSDERKYKLIQIQLADVAKEFGKPRMTSIVPIEELGEYSENKATEVEDYNLKMFITKDMYLKKLPLTSMRGKFTNRLKEDDSFTFEEEMTNLGEVIVFTNKYNIYKKRISEIEDTKPSELGNYIPSMFDYEKSEQPLFAIPMRKEFDQVVVLGFSDGSVAKIDTKAYYTKQNRQILKNGYADGKELIYVGLENEGESVYLKGVSENGYAVVRDLNQIKPKMSRSSEGNRFMVLNEDDKVKSYDLASEEDIEKYLTKTASKGKKIK